ncbi:MAG: hypothetical protein COA45_12375 [Zetaproteobacteria bacterium]|nr:MAG: hypothetical protein COA45_12375 [Zetaproteobacteria bacterium]
MLIVIDKNTKVADMKQTKTILILFISFLLVGCKSVTLSQDHSFNKKSTKGLVVVSFTHEKPLSYSSVWLNYGALDKIYRKGREHFYGIFVDSNFLETVPTSSDFDDVFGKLVVAELEPNTYEIAGLSYFMDSRQYNLAYPRDEKPHFEVKAGEITYLGEYQVKRRERMVIRPGPQMTKNNKQERDFAVMRQKYPNIIGF